MGRRVPIAGIIVIPLRERSPYGDDVAATGRTGRPRASVRGRVGHITERSSGYSAVRVSGRAQGRSSGTATASAGAGDSAASESRTRAAAQMKPLGVAVQHLANPVFLSKPTEPPL